MKNALFCYLLFFVASSCQETTLNEYEKLDQEIAALKTLEGKKNYLEKIFNDDQQVRGPEGADIMLTYGKDSKEHLDYIKAQWKQDEINLYKIEKYLELYGHPQKDQLGDIATSSPWAVIHHQTDLDKRNRNFGMLYQAYLDGNLDDGALSFYLGRTYSMTFGKRLEMKSPFQSKDEINLLIKELKLKI